MIQLNPELPSANLKVLIDSCAIYGNLALRLKSKLLAILTGGCPDDLAKLNCQLILMGKAYFFGDRSNGKRSCLQQIMIFPRMDSVRTGIPFSP
jgi:hypothetical protein